MIKVGYKGEKSATTTWLMFVDILLTSKDKMRIGAFSQHCFLSAVEVLYIYIYTYNIKYDEMFALLQIFLFYLQLQRK